MFWNGNYFGFFFFKKPVVYRYVYCIAAVFTLHAKNNRILKMLSNSARRSNVRERWFKKYVAIAKKYSRLSWYIRVSRWYILKSILMSIYVMGKLHSVT